MNLYLLLNLVSLFGLPVYLSCYHYRASLRELNLKLCFYLLFFAVLSYLRSYSLPSFCFKYFHFAKFMVFGQYYLVDSDMLRLFATLNALTFYFCIMPFPESCPSMAHLSPAQHSALLNALPSSKGLIYLFYHVPTYDKCKIVFYNYNRIA